MNLEALDFYFPFVVFFYGFLVSIVSAIPHLMRIGEERMPEKYMQQLQAHKGLALFCLIIGSLWSMQNLLVA